jgi:hypothetical protein
MPMTTEHEAWLELASWWDDAKTDGSDEGDGDTVAGCPFENEGLFFGICACLQVLKDEELISTETYVKMKNRLNKVLIDNDAWADFLYPLTPEGARYRAALCRQFAEECYIPMIKGERR